MSSAAIAPATRVQVIARSKRCGGASSLEASGYGGSGTTTSCGNCSGKI